MKTPTTLNKPLKAAHPFDASSALLFAVLSIGAFSAASTVHAQSATNNPPLTAPANSAPVRPAAPNPGFTPPIPHSATTPSPALAPQLGNPAGASALQAQNSQAGAAFARADTNKDGQLSPQEAVMLPAISEKFQALDRNRDKFLSLEEFVLATRS
jgi:hypothetical protein